MIEKIVSFFRFLFGGEQLHKELARMAQYEEKSWLPDHGIIYELGGKVLFRSRAGHRLVAEVVSVERDGYVLHRPRHRQNFFRPPSEVFAS